MSIRKKKLEELELMSYNDIAYEIIKEDKKAEIVCPKCNKKYHFLEEELIEIYNTMKF